MTDFREVLGDVHLHELGLLGLTCELSHVVSGVLRAVLPDLVVARHPQPLHPLLSLGAVLLGHDDDLLVPLLILEGLSDQRGVVCAVLVLQPGVEPAVTALAVRACTSEACVLA